MIVPTSYLILHPLQCSYQRIMAMVLDSSWSVSVGWISMSLESLTYSNKHYSHHIIPPDIVLDRMAP